MNKFIHQYEFSKLRYLVQIKFDSSGRIELNGNEIIELNGNEIMMSIKSEPKHGKANREMIRKISKFFVVPENKHPENP